MEIQLPPHTDGTESPQLPDFRQLTLIGANGSGKTRFMNKIMESCGDKAFRLSAPEAFYPERKPSDLPACIDMQYADALKRSPYLKADAVSEFDKLMFLLLNDECTYLLGHKSRQLFGENPGPLKPTRLDRLIETWHAIFPDNQILSRHGTLMFSTSAGEDAVSAIKLSKGEKAALYYIAATLYAPHGGVIFIDAPSMFLHPGLLNAFWNNIEKLRPDCIFVYNTYDVGFVATRTEGVCIWVKGFDAATQSWDYCVMAPGHLSDDLTLQLIGARRPVLFIEGDATHSLDAKLYTLVFADYTVRPLGSCDKVIESTRAFSDLSALHHLRSAGIVDRDRRTVKEVEYLRRKNILVPEVAEIENLFIIESVIRIMAELQGRNPDKVFNKVKAAVMRLWEKNLDSQVLQHTRHRVKRLAEYRIDGRFRSIRELEHHIECLSRILNPSDIYNRLHQQFMKMLQHKDYASILKVFNHKSMLAECGIDRLLGFRNVDCYISAVFAALKSAGKCAERLTAAFRDALMASPDLK